MTDIKLLAQKIAEIEAELKRNDWWKTSQPSWVNEHIQGRHDNIDDFSEWLQFIYLPRLQAQLNSKKEMDREDYVAPQAVKFFRGDEQTGKLLQLLIELDSL
jgi:uncharacterized protein YqcC (DUF446 family)